MVDLSVIRLSGVWLNRRNFAPKSKSIFEMNIKSIITAAIALLISTACSGGAKQEKVMNKDGKSLVVFFSHAGDNYAVGNIEVGNTKIVADYITEVTGAEQFEIVTHKYDGMAYNPLINPFHHPRRFWIGQLCRGCEGCIPWCRCYKGIQHLRSRGAHRKEKGREVA